MQFLSTTWSTWGQLAPDRPPEAVPDVHNAWDAIYSAAGYLCGPRTDVGDLRAAVLRYNRSESYYRQVMAKAQEYGLGTTDPGGETTTVVGSADRVIAAAMTQLGVPYRWGGTTPGVGFDCSGLVQWAFAQAGVTLPRTTSQQILTGVAVGSAEDLRHVGLDRGRHSLRRLSLRQRAIELRTMR
ncbi:MAG: C40 family peptidase [Acidimicrobiales bacterium]